MYNYHDATLKSTTVDWESGITTLVFALCAEPARDVTVSVRDTTALNFQRHFPWGKSVSVNSLDVQQFASSCRLEIEMQSGDKIVILGKDVLERAGDQSP